LDSEACIGEAVSESFLLRAVWRTNCLNKENLGRVLGLFDFSFDGAQEED
jgi:hypothetical protein